MAPKVEAARERLYDDEFYAWTRQQASLLRARRFDALDLGHSRAGKRRGFGHSRRSIGSRRAARRAGK